MTYTEKINRLYNRVRALPVAAKIFIPLGIFLITFALCSLALGLIFAGLPEVHGNMAEITPSAMVIMLLFKVGMITAGIGIITFILRTLCPFAIRILMALGKK